MLIEQQKALATAVRNNRTEQRFSGLLARVRRVTDRQLISNRKAVAQAHRPQYQPANSLRRGGVSKGIGSGQGGLTHSPSSRRHHFTPITLIERSLTAVIVDIAYTSTL